MLYLVRGLPGSGKTTLAKKLGGNWVAADDFFVSDGQYCFDPEQLAMAHSWCEDCAKTMLAQKVDVAVHNTFSQRWEMQPYLQAAKFFKSGLTVIDLYDAGLTDEQLATRNTHGVPLATIRQMRARWEHDWKNGNPLAPWERR